MLEYNLFFILYLHNYAITIFGHFQILYYQNLIFKHFSIFKMLYVHKCVSS